MSSCLTMIERILHNIVRMPGRTIQSASRRLAPSHRMERDAARFVNGSLTRDRIEALLAVPGYTAERKCQLLYYLASVVEADGCVVEIGAYKGKSTAWLAEASRRTGRRLISIDPHVSDSYEEFRRVVEEFGIEEVATIHRAFSYDVAAGWTDPIALLWIDGCHEYDAVLRDIQDFTPHVSRGGWVVFDDANEESFPGVVRAIEETLERDARWHSLGRLGTLALFCRR